jgi:hypothetical protein
MAKNEFYVSCLCGCGLLKFDYDEDIGLDLSYNIPAFYAFQEIPWNRFKRIVKMVWYIIRGKEFYLYDILLENKERVRI